MTDREKERADLLDLAQNRRTFRYFSVLHWYALLEWARLGADGRG